MIIDMHAHVGDMRMGLDGDNVPVTWDNLLRRLDEEGIERAAVLPVYNASPEGAPPAIALLGARMSVRDQVLDAAPHRDRIIPFGNMDPRWLNNDPSSDFCALLEWFTDHGCVGIGEVTANIPFDDPRTINMFRQCGAAGLMVTIESTNMAAGHYGLQDEPGMPRLDRLVRSAPGTVIIAHGPGFWAEMASPTTAEDKGGYPSGSIEEEGAVWRLLREHANLYADLSARSGLNAITRDAAAGARFLTEFQNKLLFGTDICYANSSLRGRLSEHLTSLRDSGSLPQSAFDKIMSGNALRLLPRSQ